MAEFEKSRSPHASADAHGHHAVFRLAPPSLDQEVAGQPRTRHPIGMADRDRAAVDVELVRIDAELVAAIDHLDRVGLVQPHRSISSIFSPCRFRSRGIATTGPTPISSGSTPAATKPRKMPSGLMPFCAATVSLITTQADAPSDNWLALPALMVLPSNTGLMPASPAAVVSGRGPSSCASVTC